jgi:hypothetical protein
MSLQYLEMVYKLPKEAVVKSILMLYIVMELWIKKRGISRLVFGRQLL